MSASLPVLYVKSGCPWCADVSAFMTEHGIAHREKNVSLDAEAMAEMRRLSGQSKAPVLDWNGTLLSDFGVEELVPFLKNLNVKWTDR
jgi:glutaredoxin 3